MKVPELSCGEYAAVRRRVNRWVSRASDDFSRIRELIPTVSLSRTGHLIHVGHPRLGPPRGSEHFSPYLLIDALISPNRAASIDIPKLFVELTHAPWSLASIISFELESSVWYPAPRLSLIKACLRDWEDYCALGDRFVGVFVSGDVWAVCKNVKAALVLAGLEERRVVAASRDDFPELVREALECERSKKS